MGRDRINPPLEMSFDRVCDAIFKKPGKQTPELETTGNVSFVAEAKFTREGRRFISLPHSNRIYETDWGFRSNSMGKDGQRIGHYSIPIDKWAQNL